MSDFEMFMAVTEAWNTVFSMFTVYLSVTFAFLVTGYLIAAQLKAGVVSIVVALYTAAVAMSGLCIERYIHNAVGIAGELRSAVLAGKSSLGWVGHATEPVWIAPAVYFIFLALLIMSYLGALVFFFHQRHVGRAQ